jgi:hypothetical protein
MRYFLLCLLVAGCLGAAPPIAEKTAGLEKLDGFVPLYWDAKQGRMLIEIARWKQEFLYVSSLPAGVGSNDIGLDRGQLGRTRVVRFERIGPKVLLVQSNLEFRADSKDEAERRAVRESFAESVLWGFEVLAEDGERVLADATAFLLRDAHGLPDRLKNARQGDYRLDASRSAFFLERTKGFPRNTEVEVTLTFTGGPAGAWLASVTPSADAVTVREHHSFIALPEPGFQPRAFDPRGGYSPISFFDYATPIDQPIEKRFIRRHRLVRKDPSATLGDPVQPIVYYLDRGAPEPIRSALLDGARWWNAAFEAAGFRNAFRVELLPEGADPMDVRYNVIQWVHRSTRGWSYGASVIDPRTGEILKGHVSLGSLRVRQDYLIAEAYLAPYAAGAANPEMLAMSLQRLRQLSAHEVGHTLGLSHNYIASAFRDASVMDYPHPRIELDAAGVPSLKNAYPTGIGEWDKVAITWGYAQFPAGTDQKPALDRILVDAARRDIRFLTDQDARPESSSDPRTHLWDNGANAVDELNRLMQVRAAALARFGENNVKPGASLSLLEDALAPLYFGHRYQLEAASKTIGGLEYRYALRGDGQTPTTLVPAAEQMRALDAILATLKPGALRIPERILQLIPPRPDGMDRTRELFRGRNGANLDPLAAAETLASMAWSLVLQPERLNRVVTHSTRDAAQPRLEPMLRRILAATWTAPRLTGPDAEYQRVVELALARQLIASAQSPLIGPAARGLVEMALNDMKRFLPGDNAQTAHAALVLRLIERHFTDPKPPSLPAASPAPPPGMPIGMLDGCWHW